jgi:hypothetical protein
MKEVIEFNCSRCGKLAAGDVRQNDICCVPVELGSNTGSPRGMGMLNNSHPLPDPEDAEKSWSMNWPQYVKNAEGVALARFNWTDLLLSMRPKTRLLMKRGLGSADGFPPRG